MTRVLHLDVERRSEELLALAGSLWHKGAYNRTFPCMEAKKNQRGASKITPKGYFGCDELVLYGTRLLAQATHDQ